MFWNTPGLMKADLQWWISVPGFIPWGWYIYAHEGLLFLLVNQFLFHWSHHYFALGMDSFCSGGSHHVPECHLPNISIWRMWGPAFPAAVTAVAWFTTSTFSIRMALRLAWYRGWSPGKHAHQTKTCQKPGCHQSPSFLYLNLLSHPREHYSIFSNILDF